MLVESIVRNIAVELMTAQRPLLIYGAGIHLAGAEKEAKSVREMSCVPMVATWGAADLIPDCGTFGTHGNKYGNLAVQNADYILCVGSRLDTKATGYPVSSFAPKAKLVMVDIDRAELDKMEKIGRPLYRSIRADAKEFLSMLDRQLMAMAQQEESWPSFGMWRSEIAAWMKAHPVPSEGPYAFVKRLSQYLTPDDVIVSDTGCSLAWMMQAYPFKGERFLHAFNQTPMGYGLPAAIGAAFATGKRVILITGDGGLSVNITELATLAGHNLPVKIILFRNGAHSMCMSTQRQWLNGEYPATSKEGGLHFPDFMEVSFAYGINVVGGVSALLYGDGPAFYQLDVDRDWDVVGQIKFGEPLAEAA
jgi:acetolactate synthase-1/2/3 large subunit